MNYYCYDVINFLLDYQMMNEVEIQLYLLDTIDLHYLFLEHSKSICECMIMTFYPLKKP